MNKTKFIIELSEVIEKNKIDKLIGKDKRKIAIALYEIIITFYGLPKKEEVKK